jgi:hypothetical protein
VRVVLKPEAVIAVLRVGESGAPEPIRFVDAQDRDVPRATIKGRPDRVAAIYFEHLTTPGARPSSYREYVISNESMIESWSVGDDDARLEITTEADALDALAKHLRHVPTAPVDPQLAWRKPSAQSLAEVWASTLALTSDHYRLSAEAITVLAAKLRALPPETTVLAVRPTVTFPKQPPITPYSPTVKGGPKTVPYRSPLYTYALPKRPPRP